MYTTVLLLPGLINIRCTPVGDQYPGARVRGMDLSPIQPVWVPPNVEFLVDNCENEWLMRDCDLAHFRYTIPVLKDVPKILGNAYEYVSSKP